MFLMACRSESGGLLGDRLLLFPSFRRTPESRKKLKTLDPGVRGQRTEDRGQKAEISLRPGGASGPEGDRRSEGRNQDKTHRLMVGSLTEKRRIRFTVMSRA